MKATFIITSAFIFLISGCANTHQIPGSEEIEIVEAQFKHWSEAPVVDSDVRERGTDLKLTVQNWPEGVKPIHVIFRDKKSFPAEITDSTETGLQISARIVMRSAVLSETSETVDLSDRLVFCNEEGETGYVEIKEWGRMRDE